MDGGLSLYDDITQRLWQQYGIFAEYRRVWQLQTFDIYNSTFGAAHAAKMCGFTGRRFWDLANFHWKFQWFRKALSTLTLSTSTFSCLWRLTPRTLRSSTLTILTFTSSTFFAAHAAEFDFMDFDFSAYIFGTSKISTLNSWRLTPHHGSRRFTTPTVERGHRPGVP